MNILIIGGAGFLGKYLILKSLERGYSTSVFDIKPVDIADIRCLEGDICSQTDVISAVEGMDVVFNLSALSDIDECIKNPINCVKLNILGNTNILDACVKKNVKRFIFASSVYAGGNQSGFYGSSKKASENLIKDYNRYHGLQYTILRYGTLFGKGAPPENSIFRYLKEAIEDKKISYTGDGSEIRELIHVEDASSLSFESIEDKYLNKTLALVGNHRIKMNDLFLMIEELLNYKIQINYSKDSTRGISGSHYRVSPYRYNRDNIYKLLKTYNRELGDAFIEIIEDIHDRF